MMLSVNFKFSGMPNESYSLVISRINGEVVKHYKTKRVAGIVNFRAIDFIKRELFVLSAYSGKLLISSMTFDKTIAND